MSSDIEVYLAQLTNNSKPKINLECHNFKETDTLTAQKVSKLLKNYFKQNIKVENGSIVFSKIFDLINLGNEQIVVYSIIKKQGQYLIQLFNLKWNSKLITAMADLIKTFYYEIHESDLLKLSPAENKLLPMLANGDSVADIAKKVFRSKPTIVKHSTSIKKKLKVNNIMELHHLCKMTGII